MTLALAAKAVPTPSIAAASTPPPATGWPGPAPPSTLVAGFAAWSVLLFRQRSRHPESARETLRRYWRFSGPTQFLTWEILMDDFGRPYGGPRPYRYFTENGVMVKERWL